MYEFRKCQFLNSRQIQLLLQDLVIKIFNTASIALYRGSTRFKISHKYLSSSTQNLTSTDRILIGFLQRAVRSAPCLSPLFWARLCSSSLSPRRFRRLRGQCLLLASKFMWTLSDICQTPPDLKKPFWCDSWIFDCRYLMFAMSVTTMVVMNCVIVLNVSLRTPNTHIMTDKVRKVRLHSEP